jgi:hypothetical protein
MSFANLMNRMSTLAENLTEKIGTDSFFVLRATKTLDGKGGSTKPLTATTAAAIPCFYNVLPSSHEKLEEVSAAQRKPVIFRRFVCKASADVRHNDTLRLVARGEVGQIDMQIVKVAPLTGVMLEIITVEETPAA